MKLFMWRSQFIWMHRRRCHFFLGSLVCRFYQCKYRLIVCNVHLVRQKKIQLQNNITHSILASSINCKVRSISRRYMLCRLYINGTNVSNQSKFASFSLDWIDTGVEQFAWIYWTSARTQTLIRGTFEKFYAKPVVCF